MKILNKIGIFTILIVFIFFIGFRFIQVKADSETIQMAPGASIRTEGTQGLRFSATFDVSHREKTRGFAIIFGKANIADLQAVITNPVPTINGKEVVFMTNYDQTSLTLAVVLTGIPEIGYDQDITVIGYAKDETTYTFVPTALTRNITDVARVIYDTQPVEYDGALKTLVDGIVTPKRIKVTSAVGNKAYYNDFAGIILVEGDKLELTRGWFSERLTVNVNNIEVLGANSNVSIDAKGLRSENSLAESVYSDKWLLLADGTNNFTLNGIKFTGERGLHLLGTHNNISVSYCSFTTSGNFSIDDNGSDCLISNIIIKDNYFHSSNTVYTREVFFWGFINNIEVSENYFENYLSELSGDDYGIRLMKLSDGSQVDIYKNTFNKLGSSYIIDIGYMMGDGATRTLNCKVNINIEDNLIVPTYTTCLGGNAIRVMYIGTNSRISILRNSIRTSPYYNAILLTTGEAANSPTATEGLIIEIMYNKFYAEALDKVTQPTSRNTSSRFIRFGLGIPESSTVIFEKNYYGSSTSRAAYTLNTSSIAFNGTNQTQPTVNKVDSGADANSGYTNSLSDFVTVITNYLSAMGTLSNTIDAYFGGSDSENILNYIPLFAENDSNEFEIQYGKLVYVGSKLYYKRAAIERGVFPAVTQKVSP